MQPEKVAFFVLCAYGFSERFVLYESLIFGRFVSDLVENWICGLYKAVMSEIKELEAKRAELDKEIDVYLKELGII